MKRIGHADLREGESTLSLGNLSSCMPYGAPSGYRSITQTHGQHLAVVIGSYEIENIVTRMVYDHPRYDSLSSWSYVESDLTST